MIDPLTREQLHRVADLATREGSNMFELMDRAGLIATVDHNKATVGKYLDLLLAQISQFQPAQIAGQDQTVTGAVNGMINYIRMFQDLMTK